MKDSEGYYTSIDIEDMRANNYQVEIVNGYYWESKGYIFKEFIEDLFQKKQNSEKGSVQYGLAKLFMNSLYGKMIQRPIYNKSITISTNAEYWKFWGDYIINGIEHLGDKVVITGTPRDENKMENSITKPTHLGAFILAYSRRIMLDYIKQANPHFDSEDIKQRIKNDIYYTDTDSLHLHIDNAKLLSNFNGKNLGDISNDLGDDCKIIKATYIAPKLYMLKYVKRNGSIHYHYKGKGLNTDALHEESYDKMDKGSSLKNVRKFQMKKINIKRFSTQSEIPQFSIIHLTNVEKTVNTKQWDGRLFIDDNSSIPV